MKNNFVDYLVIHHGHWLHFDTIKFIVEHLDLEVGCDFQGFGVGGYVMGHILLVTIEEGKHLLHQRLETRLSALRYHILLLSGVHRIHR